MISKRIIAIGGLLFVALSFYYINVMRTFTIKANNLDFKPKQQRTKLTIDTPGCQIPYLDPMHPSVAHLIQNLDPLVCETILSPPVIPVNNPIHPSVKLLSNTSHNANTTCFYRKMYRETDMKTVIDSEKHIIDKEDVNVTDEFINVNCVANNRSVFSDHLSFIQKKPEVEKRCRKAKILPKPVEQLSVLLLGIDSVSRSNFLRHMKRTQDFLAKKSPHYVDLLGYNKVGKNTYPNVVAMLTGHLDFELPDTTKVYANTLPLIWNEFAENGYRTLFNEDIPAITMFNYARKGFGAQPTDYYLRPFSLAVEESSAKTKHRMGCLNGRLEADVVLNWTADFFDVFANKPVFALTYLTRLTHDNLNTLSQHDEPYIRFFKRLKNGGHLEKSIVFFFSDHGFRYGSIRSTYIGRMEGKLPFMYILVPSWFPTKYPVLYANLQTNSHRLITALDIYATLKDILNFTGQVSTTKQGRSMSLMSGLISKNRTCKDAHIAHQFCACTKTQLVSPTSELVLKAAHLLIDTINGMTRQQRNNCAEITLDRVNSAAIQEVDLGEQDAENASLYYQVIFQVTPSNGIFEGFVWFLNDDKSYHADKEIERINRYGDQSICINDAALKPFCYCNNKTF